MDQKAECGFTAGDGTEVDIEHRILEEAVRQGLVPADVVANVEALPDDGVEETLPPSRWGFRVALLIRRGILTHEQVDRLAAEIGITVCETPITDHDSGDRGLPADRVPTSGSGRRPQDSRETIEEWGRYTDLELIGRGGMARVFRGFDRRLDRYVAIKILRDDDPLMVDRFLAEARAQAKVVHDNVCRIFEVGDVDGRPYIVMELIDGVTLGKLAPSLDRQQVLDVMIKVCSAVHAAHLQGLIHRDIKPSNVMVERNPDGSVKPYVLDFGLAREQESRGLTVTGTVLGTPGYMAPEQTSGHSGEVDRRTDVYALGATLYHVLAGRPPFEGSVFEVMVSMARDDAEPLKRFVPGIPSDLDTIVKKCLEKNPENRYQSAQDLADELDRHARGEPIAADPPSLATRALRKVRRHRAVAGVVAASFLVLLVVAIGWLISLRNTRENAELAQRLTQEISRLEDRARLVRLKPIHDTRSELQEIRERLVEIEGVVSESRAGVFGPGYYALGRGYLALRDYRESRRHLERAWDQGFQDPEVAFAIGLVMVNLYRSELERARGLADRAALERRRSELDEELLDPARRFLEAGREAEIEAPEYVDGVIALLEQRYEEALASARRALERVPNLYLGRVLEGEIHTETARIAFNSGDYPQAEEQLSAAEVAYSEVVRSAPSDPLGYLGRCRVFREWMLLDAELGRSPEPRFEASVESCEEALSIDPEDLEGLHGRALSHILWADYLGRHGRDASHILEESASLVEEILDGAPNDGTAHAYLGIVLRRMGQHQAIHGDDPRDFFVRSVEHLEKAVDLKPNDSLSLNNLGLTYFFWAFHDFENGIDPRPTVSGAVEAFRRLLEVDPTSMNARDNMGVAHWLAAQHEVQWGLDPRSSLAAADQVLRDAVNQNPRDIVALNNLCLVHGDLAEFEIARGDDPSGSIAAAVKFGRRVVEINPADPYAYTNLGEAHRLGALRAVAGGGSPTSGVASARQVLEQAIAANPSDPEPWLVLGRTEVVVAKWNMAEGQSPVAAFRRAQKAFTGALEVNPGYSPAHVEIAKAAVAEADWKTAHGEDPIADLERARGHLEMVGPEVTKLPEYIGIRGSLDLVRARVQSAPDPAGLVARGCRSVRAAVAGNRWLERELARYLGRCADDVL